MADHTAEFFTNVSLFENVADWHPLLVYGQAEADGAPFVANVAPPSSLDGNDPFMFGVYDSVDFTRIVVTIRYAGLVLQEVVWHGSFINGVIAGAFTPAYQATSSVQTDVSGDSPGLLFRVLRRPVWPDAPELQLFAVDETGMEV